MTCRTDEMSHSTPRNLLDVMEASPPEFGIEMAPNPGTHERAPQQLFPLFTLFYLFIFISPHITTVMQM